MVNIVVDVFILFVPDDAVQFKVACRTKLANTLLTAASAQSFIAPSLLSLAVLEGGGGRGR